MAGNTESFEELKAKAESGDVEAMIDVGLDYCDVTNDKLDLYEAKKWFELAKQNGSDDAETLIDHLEYTIGYKSSAPFTYAVKLAQFKMFHDKNVRTFYRAENLYRRSRYEEAKDLFLQLYNGGDNEAAYWIACILLITAKTEEDFDLIINYLEQTPGYNDHIDQKAMCRIKEMIYAGSNIRPKLAHELLCKLYELNKNDTKVRHLLAHNYYAGIGTEVDKQKALELYYVNFFNLMDYNDSRYHYEFGKLLMELPDADGCNYSFAIDQFIIAMSQLSKEAYDDIEALLLAHDPFAYKVVIHIYHHKYCDPNPLKAANYIKEYFLYCGFDEDMPHKMSVLAEYYFKGQGNVQSFSLTYFWLALSMSFDEWLSDKKTMLMDKLMQLIDPKDIRALQKIVKKAHTYICSLPKDSPMGDLEVKFMSNMSDAEDYDQLVISNINLSIELAELKNARDGLLDKAVSFHRYFNENKFDVEKVSLMLCVQNPSRLRNDLREDMCNIAEADLEGFYVFYEDQKDYKNFRVYNKRIGHKIRNLLLKLAYYSISGGDQLYDLLPEKIDEPISRLNTMFCELFKPYLDKVKTPFIDLNGFQIQVTLDHPEYIDPCRS